jgi:hypothetical protein
MKRLNLRTNLVGCLFVVAVLACNLSLKLPSNPQPPVPSLVPQASDADAFEQNFQQAVNQAAQSGNFSASITQQQFSSWLALRAPGYARQQGYEWPLKDVQAGLDSGKITLYGVITQPNVPETPAQIVFTPSIDGNGELAVSVESGQVGVVGVPPDILKNLNKTIQDALASQLNQIKGHYKLTNLTVAGGTLTVSGQVVR